MTLRVAFPTIVQPHFDPDFESGDWVPDWSVSNTASFRPPDPSAPGPEAEALAKLSSEVYTVDEVNSANEKLVAQIEQARKEIDVLKADIRAILDANDTLTKRLNDLDDRLKK